MSQILNLNQNLLTKYLIDSNFNLHDWEDIINGVGAEEFSVTIPKGDWGTDSSDIKIYIIYSSFFKAEGYNYFIFPEGESSLAYGNAGITPLEVGAGYVKLTCINALEETIYISFFRSKQAEEDQPSNIATIYIGEYDSLLGGLSITVYDTYEDVRNALDNKGLTYVDTKMYLYGDDHGYDAHLFNRIKNVKDDEIEFTFFIFDENGTYDKMEYSRTFLNFFHALTGYEPQEQE